MLVLWDVTSFLHSLAFPSHMLSDPSKAAIFSCIEKRPDSTPTLKTFISGEGPTYIQNKMKMCMISFISCTYFNSKRCREVRLHVVTVLGFWEQAFHVDEVGTELDWRGIHLSLTHSWHRCRASCSIISHIGFALCIFVELALLCSLNLLWAQAECEEHSFKCRQLRKVVYCVHYGCKWCVNAFEKTNMLQKVT